MFSAAKHLMMNRSETSHDEPQSVVSNPHKKKNSEWRGELKPLRRFFPETKNVFL
jgi:hypothetical protein